MVRGETSPAPNMPCPELPQQAQDVPESCAVCRNTHPHRETSQSSMGSSKTSLC